MTTFEEFVRKQLEFSTHTFGPGERTRGVSDHIRDELKEIEENPDDGLRSNEWRDVALLGLDGLWRSLSSEGVPDEEIPRAVVRTLEEKLDINIARKWPDWRDQSPDKAIEHIR